MQVELYVYDLSRGMARQYSQAFTGVQIDAIYHTAIVLNSVEYFFGQGIHRKVPGSTHHGRPMKVIKLGKTDLPMDVIEEYVQSLESIYTPESYDLFLHNCNNFTQDLAIFLVGKSIPEEIRSLPETFLRTPMGQMLRTQLDQSMRTMTQAPDAVSGRSVPTTNSTSRPNAIKPATNGTYYPPAFTPTFINATPPKRQPGQVYNLTSLSTLNTHLTNAGSTCAVLFFTSATCPPCKIVYPAYDELAASAGPKCTFIKIDVSQAYEIGSRYSVRATPTFMTFLNGERYEEWSGADEGRLRGNVRLLISMANPGHGHTRLKLPSMHGKIERPILYGKVPPLDKLVAKLKNVGKDEVVRELVGYVQTRDKEGMANARIPDLQRLSEWVAKSYTTLPIESRFALVDLIRFAAVDPRVSSYLTAEDRYRTLETLIPSRDWASTPYQLRIVSCQLACNLFSSVVFQQELCRPGSQVKIIVERLSDCLITDHAVATQAAAALTYNLAAINHNERVHEQPEKLQISEDIEASLTSAIYNLEESKDTLHSLLMALGLLLYGAPQDSGIWELCNAMDVREALMQKAKMEIFKGEPLLKEVGDELLANKGV